MSDLVEKLRQINPPLTLAQIAVVEEIITPFQPDNSIANKRLALYQKAINKIDDYFEYAMVSEEDQEAVHKILLDLTKALTKESK